MAYFGLSKVISGGQTGADQGGLLAAHEMFVQTGGTCPLNWHTQTGPNPLLGALGLVCAGTLRTRTIKNVQDADATVLLTISPNSPGSVLTRNSAGREHKPFLEIDLNTVLAEHGLGDAGAVRRHHIQTAAVSITDFIRANSITVLNVAGNRERDLMNLSLTFTVKSILVASFQQLMLDNLLIRNLNR